LRTLIKTDSIRHANLYINCAVQIKLVLYYFHSGHGKIISSGLKSRLSCTAKIRNWQPNAILLANECSNETNQVLQKLGTHHACCCRLI